MSCTRVVNRFSCSCSLALGYHVHSLFFFLSLEWWFESRWVVVGRLCCFSFTSVRRYGQGSARSRLDPNPTCHSWWVWCGVCHGNIYVLWMQMLLPFKYIVGKLHSRFLPPWESSDAVYMFLDRGIMHQSSKQLYNYIQTPSAYPILASRHPILSSLWAPRTQTLCILGLLIGDVEFTAVCFRDCVSIEGLSVKPACKVY